MNNESAIRIRVLLLQRGVTQADLARRAGVCHQAIYRVIHGLSRSLRLEELVAEAVGVAPEKLFPAPVCRKSGSESSRSDS